MKKIFLALVSLMVLTASQVYAQFPDPPSLRLEVMRSVTERWGGDGPYSSTYYLRATNTGRSTIAGGAEVSLSTRVSDTQGTLYGGLNNSRHTVQNDLGPGQSFEFIESINPGRPFVPGDYIFIVESLTLLGQTATNVLSYRYRVDVQPVPSRANLVVEGLEIRPASPQSGNTVSIIGTVANRGTRNANGVLVRMQLVRDNRTISNWQDLRVDSMVAGSSHSVTRITENLEAGIYMVMLTVDPNDVITEIRKSDNSRTRSFRVGSGVSADSVPSLQLTVTNSVTERWGGDGPYSSTYYLRATNTGRSTIAGGAEVSLSTRVSDTQGTLYGGLNNSRHTVQNDLGPGQSFEFIESINPGRPFVPGDYIFIVESLTLLDPVNRIQSRTATNVLSYRYIIGGGSIVTTIEPKEARDARAFWWVDGVQSNSKSSGETVSNLSPGSHRVEFRELGGWKKPDVMQVNIRSTEMVRLTGTYVQRGSLSMTIEPARARDAGARWRMYGGDWQNSGNIVRDLIPGQYNIEFKETAGWVKPEDLHPNIPSGETSRQIGRYTEMGYLTVTLQPQDAVTAGAQWRVVGFGGGAWQNSGATLSVPEGQHYYIECKPASGWVKPPNPEVNIVSSQTVQTRLEYSRPTVGIQVTISPEAALSSARWRVVGQANWHTSGETVFGLSPGDQYVEFNNIGDSWEKPSNKRVFLIAGRTEGTHGTYRPIYGMLNVTIKPNEAIQAGAQWRQSGLKGGLWKPSGATMADILAGQHQIEFKDITGWTKPATQNVLITGSQTTQAQGEYRQASGSLVVTIQPQEVVARGAQWRVEGGAWQASGSKVPNVNAGQKNIEYKEIPGWIKPASHTVNVTAGGSAVATGRYNRR